MNFIVALLYCTLILSFKIPKEILAHFKSLFFKNKRIPPSLSQRIMTTMSRTFELYLPTFLLKLMIRTLSKIIYSVKGRRWVKKLDANNEKDGWEGYLIADNVKHSEIGKDADMIILYAHGGAFVFGDALMTLEMFIDWIKTWKSNHGVNTQILSLEYRLSPKYSFPIARDNILACYEWLVTEKNISPSKIAFAGDSAGGNLAIVSAIHLVNNPCLYSIDPPAAIVLLSPFLSGMLNTRSVIDNASYDTLDPTWLHRCMESYIGDSNLLISNSMISPVFESQLSDLPKVWACAGGYEIFLDDIKKFIGKLIQNDVKAELVIEDTNFHDYAIGKAASRDGAYERSIKYIGNFLLRYYDIPRNPGVREKKNFSREILPSLCRDAPSLCWDATFPLLGCYLPEKCVTLSFSWNRNSCYKNMNSLNKSERYRPTSILERTFQPVNVTRSILSTFFQEINLELPKEIKLNEKVEVVNGMTTNQKRTFWNRL
ncbi:alpha/beta hydrolase [Rhizophagus clarus]|uniref:Alpha/beta hydrolase n=1 Tax=Rhizophagus clarus TaxID=94130 RepID=A0A8H3LRC4_9GLOM|nr:alpha/beta hydrolase [Rhizophagus clarus]